MPPIDPQRFEEKMLIDAIWLWQNPATVEGLLRKGVNPNSQDGGCTALEFAAFMPDTEALELLLAFKANPNFQSAGGNTALHSVGSTSAIGLLIDAGGKVNATNARGMTPLHAAVLREDGEAVSCLLEQGADPAVVDAHGKTPENLARDDAATLTIFRAWRARQSSSEQADRLSSRAKGQRPPRRSI